MEALVVQGNIARMGRLRHNSGVERVAPQIFRRGFMQKRWRTASLIALFALLAAAQATMALADSEPALPLAVGDALAAGWTVNAVQRHPEFVVFSFAKGAETTAVEVRYHEGPPNEWATRHYRVQPALDASPPVPLLIAVKKRIDAWEAESGKTPFVSEAKLLEKDSPAAEPEPAGPPPWLPIFGLPLIATALYWSIARRRPSRRAWPARLALAYVLWLIVLMPLALLSLIGVDLLSQMQRVRDLDKKALLDGLEKSLKEQPGQAYKITRLDDGKGYYPLVGGNYAPLEIGPDDFAIYVFDPFSAILPLTPPRAEDPFTAALSKRSGSAVKSFNFGRPGMTLRDTAKRAEAAFAYRRPDLALFYVGHDDYIGAYETVFADACAVLGRTRRLGTLLREYYRIFRFSRFRNENLADAYLHFQRTEIEPIAWEAMRDLGWLPIDRQTTEAANALLLAHLRDAWRPIFDLARAQSVPIVILTQASDLDARPFSPDGEAERLFAQGQAETDYARRIDLLRRAKDAEGVFGGLRAKSAYNDWLRRLNEPGVYVMDLESELEMRSFAFGKDEFNGLLHFRDDSSALSADLSADFLLAKRLCCTRPAPAAVEPVPAAPAGP